MGRDFQIKMITDVSEKDLVETLNSSNSLIFISTPENKTYTEPMSGYYPATYGFESESVGAFPMYFTDDSTSSCKAEIIASINRHNNVFWFDDNEFSYKASVHNYFNNQSYGTVEYWVQSTDVTDRYFVSLRNIDEGVTSQLGLRSDSWRDSSNNIIQKASGGNMPTPIDNQWYHVRIDFECRVSGGYMGLSQYEWKIWIDGIESDSIPFYTNTSNVNWITWETSTATSTYDCYIDAIGYSWDSNYNIGDNMNEGLLLSFTSSTSLNWTRYSLDGQVNKTISGNSTISMPIEGLHYIQVFGNNSLGETFESDIRYFTIKYFPISIITPENKTYTAPMSGYYPGTYGFEDETGQVGYGISFMDYYTASSSCYADVISNLGGHNEVLHLRDGSTGGSVWFENFCESEQIYGTIEFWIRTTDASLGTTLKLFDNSFSAGGNQAGEFKYGSDAFQVLNGNSWVVLTDPIPQDNVWYHIRVHFESSLGGYKGLSQYTYSIEINNENVGTFDYHYVPMNVKVIHFATGYVNGNYDSYIDAIGYSWDPNYDIRDNLNEGLLLSYTNRTNLDWVGYSLNGQPNKTISGNTVIPLYRNGNHSIKLYGQNSTGYTFESPERKYSIDIPAPQILIIFPQNGDIFRISAPNFSISISTPILDSTWYTMDNGITNIIFTGLIGTIDQLEWDKFGYEPVIIRFYINDSFGQESYSTVVIDKIPIAPSPPPIDFLVILLIISLVIVVIDVIVIGVVKSKRKISSDKITRRE